MLSFILTLAVIGGLIGLIFSRNGKESQDTLRGAKKGAKLGCLVIFLGFILVAFVSILALGFSF